MEQTELDSVEGAATSLGQLREAIGQAMVGQPAVVEQVLIALVASGHVLIEGAPGLGKTLLVRALARALALAHARVQFTPDMMPSDITGHSVLDPATHGLRVVRGPVFTHLLLADEINRAPAKTQSALLEVMQEYQVTIAGQTHIVPTPFLVMATQNPIETEGTYPLPEAQVDRFMMKVLVGYPNEEEEFVIVERVTGVPVDVATVASTDQLASLQRQCRNGYVDPSLIQYAVRLAAATRQPDRYGVVDFAQYVTFGASPRASIHLIEGARALAYLRGRDYVLPDDVSDLAPDVLRHRLVLSYEALADGLTPDQLVHKIMQRIPPPEKPLESHVRFASQG